MHRFSRRYFVLFVMAVFLSGVYCGIHWNSIYTRPPEAPSLITDAPNTPESVFSEGAAAPLPPEESPAAPMHAATAPSPTSDAPDAFAAQAVAAEKMPFSPPLSSFSLHKLGSEGDPTLLVIGGIQGDEPGGFSAAALIASHYTIGKGAVWVVPDLNFASILVRGRELHGDMNRKFADLDPKDPEYDIITQIKSVLLDEQVSLVLNLHDGSGFYRPTWEDALRNPKRWGQSVIIDQEEIDAPRFNLLYETALKVKAEVNQTLIDPVHRYHIRNTLTAQSSTETAKEMTKTLSYFAICNGKPAFGIEASKEFSTEYRAYYHLSVIESFMRQMGIAFERDFELTPQGVLAALNSDLKLAAYDNKWMLQLDNARPTINFLPFKKGAEPDIRTSKPLLAIVPEKGQPTWRVAYGNRTLTRVNPEFMDFDDSLDSLDMLLDGKPHRVRMGDLVTVRDSFLVKSMPGFRVTAIGALKEAEANAAGAHKDFSPPQQPVKKKQQAGLTIAHKDFMPRFSLDKNGTTYRVEVYKGAAFAGMVLVRFDKEGAFVNDAVPLTAISGPESAFGF